MRNSVQSKEFLKVHGSRMGKSLSILAVLISASVSAHEPYKGNASIGHNLIESGKTEADMSLEQIADYRCGRSYETVKRIESYMRNYLDKHYKGNIDRLAAAAYNQDGMRFFISAGINIASYDQHAKEFNDSCQPIDLDSPDAPFKMSDYVKAYKNFEYWRRSEISNEEFLLWKSQCRSVVLPYRDSALQFKKLVRKLDESTDKAEKAELEKAIQEQKTELKAIADKTEVMSCWKTGYSITRYLDLRS